MKKIVFIGSSLLVLIACSTERDSFKNRAFHSSTAWFNTLFNAEEEMDKKLEELKISYQDNYSEILPVDPRPEIIEGDILANLDQGDISLVKNQKKGDTKASEPSATGFDLVEKKALKAIENHSMLIKGKERNRMMTHAYLILGKARYNKGMGFEALEALNYLQNNLPYHKKYTPEAELYTALANIQTGNTFEGERVLQKMYKDDGFKRKMREGIAKYYAQDLIRQEKYEDAIAALDEAIDDTKNKDRKARYYFIEGQLYSLLGDQNNAGEAFTRVYKMKPGFEMEVKSQVAIAENFDPEANSYNSYKEHLLGISKKGNYVSRRNELEYAIGNMAYKANKLDESRKYLKQSFLGQASDPYIRGKAYETYANLEFDEGNYVHASAYYDSALAVAPYNKDIERITKRNESLKGLMEKYYLVKRNDSILKLANMPKEEQEKFFGDFIAKLKIEDAKKQKQEEQEMVNFQTDTKTGGFGNTFGSEGGGNSFYFYNTSQKGNGQNEFKRIWGNVKLADNWRSSTGASMSIEEKEAEMLGQVDAQNPRRYELAYYIEQIPNKPNELNRLKIERDTTELSLGIGYFDLFENAKTATTTLEHLVSTPPKDESTLAQAYYQIYRINNKVENMAKAEEYKNLILTTYPNSIYAEYIMNPEVDYITPTTKEALTFYEETYQLYKEDKFNEVKTRTSEAIKKYPTEIIIAKFALLNALAIGATEGKENFKSALELVTVAYQNTEEAKKAQDILDLLNGTNQPVARKDKENQEKETTSPLTEEEKNEGSKPKKGNSIGKPDSNSLSPNQNTNNQNSPRENVATPEQQKRK